MKVSVSITTYNHEKYIAQAVKSVLMQTTDFDFEILIGEDDSEDKTRSIVKSYQRQYPDKIRLFLNDRKNVIYVNGRPTGRGNFCNNLRNARGEYIALLDGDDYWTDKLKLQKQVDFLESHAECSICFHAFERVHEQEGERELVFPPRRKGIYTLEDFLEHSFIGSLTCVFRNGLFEYFPEWYYSMPQGDWPLHVLNAQRGHIGYIDEVMGVYRIHEGGLWASGGEVAMLEKMIEGIQIINPHLQRSHQKINMKTGASMCLRLVEFYREKGDVGKVQCFRRKCLPMFRFGQGVGLALAKLYYKMYGPRFSSLFGNRLGIRSS